MLLNEARKKSAAGFTLAEFVTSIFIAVFIFFAAWSIYYMGWRWWREIAPIIECQRIARITLGTIIDGVVDSTAGKDGNYNRRNGIAWAVYEPVISGSLGAIDKIDFGLEAEKISHDDYPTTHNDRSFYLVLDDQTGLKMLCYRDDDSAEHLVPSTLGLTELRFVKTKDQNGKVYIDVTAVVEKDVVGTRSSAYHIDVEYTDHIYLRNLL